MGNANDANINPDKHLSLAEIEQISTLYEKNGSGVIDDFFNPSKIIPVESTNGLHLGVFVHRGPLSHDASNNKVILDYLNPLCEICASIYRDEWGEQLTAKYFEDLLTGLQEKDVFIILCQYNGSERPTPVGAALAKTMTTQEVAEEIQVVVKETSGVELELDEINTNLPRNTFIYWAEVFIHRAARGGVRPFQAITNALTKELLKVHSGSTLVAQFTKGHRSQLDLAEQESIRKYFETSLVRDDIFLKKVIKLINECRNGENKQRDLRDLIHGKIGNDDIKAMEFLNKYFYPPTMPVMNFSKQIRMHQVTLPKAESNDRFVFTVPLGRLDFVSAGSGKQDLYKSIIIVQIAHVIRAIRNSLRSKES